MRALSLSVVFVNLPDPVGAGYVKSLARSPEGLLALMESANRGLIIRAGSMSR
jgi:hypothetical protein